MARYHGLLDRYLEVNQRITDRRGLTEAQARALVDEGKAIVVQVYEYARDRAWRRAKPERHPAIIHGPGDTKPVGKPPGGRCETHKPAFRSWWTRVLVPDLYGSTNMFSGAPSY